MNRLPIGLLWKLRRVAAGLRQQDVANAAGVSTTRYSCIERGDHRPTDLETRLIERALPVLPILGGPTQASTEEQSTGLISV
jgi:transcriptional regulator with XRE-family HTH domain